MVWISKTNKSGYSGRTIKPPNYLKKVVLLNQKDYFILKGQNNNLNCIVKVQIVMSNTLQFDRLKCPVKDRCPIGRYDNDPARNSN